LNLLLSHTTSPKDIILVIILFIMHRPDLMWDNYDDTLEALSHLAHS
jgi:hypothetical protein